MRVDFAAENKTSQYSGYPKVVVEAKEDARLCILESPLLVYKHTLNKPVINPETGEVAKILAKNSKGDEYEKDHFEYVGNYVCNGDPEKIQADADGLDAENCELCAAAAEHGTKKIKAPVPAYACHVIQYKVKPGTTQVQEPFQADLKLWVLNAGKFNAVVDLAAEHGDIRKTDILLTECSNKNFQNYKIGAAATGQAQWMKSDKSKALVSEMLSNNRADEERIKDTVARKLTPTSAKTAIEDVMSRWAMEGKPMSHNAVSGSFGGQVAAGNAADAQAQSGESSPWSTSDASDAPNFTKSEEKSGSSDTDNGSGADAELSFDDLVNGF